MAAVLIQATFSDLPLGEVKEIAVNVGGIFAPLFGRIAEIYGVQVVMLKTKTHLKLILLGR
ncbi:hypothetical protein SPD48_06425 [Pseudogracilibacillus sp. SE30717A]|uniref:hypothetical protein n=1 Tax=Pseudogracilibacillus sp. SE30717A TaxID=3098293 RepID=UPI00300E2B1F